MPPPRVPQRGGGVSSLRCGSLRQPSLVELELVELRELVELVELVVVVVDEVIVAVELAEVPVEEVVCDAGRTCAPGPCVGSRSGRIPARCPAVRPWFGPQAGAESRSNGGRSWGYLPGSRPCAQHRTHVWRASRGWPRLASRVKRADGQDFRQREPTFASFRS